MALVSCAAAIAKSFALDCASPLQGGYTGRAVIFDARDVQATIDSSNPRLITALTIATGKKPFAVINENDTPFTGSNTASSTENGRREYVKTVSFNDPKRGAAASKDIDALSVLPLGFIVIAEKNQRTADGGFEVIGYYQGLKVNGDGVSRDEYANGGAFGITASCRESYSEVVYNDGTYADNLAAFEGWLADAPAQ